MGLFRAPNCCVFCPHRDEEYTSLLLSLFLRFCYNPFEIPIAAACFLSFPTIRAKRAFLEEKYLCLLPMSAQKQSN
jgi:hypothetical protein